MKFRRTLALTLILTLLLSLFCGCGKKETQKKKVSSKPKEKTASEIYRQANELLDTLDAREMVQRIKANLTIGATTAEFKIDDTMVAFLEDGKYKSYYRKNDVTVFSVYETLSYSYVDGVYYYSDDEQRYRQNMTPEEFKKSETEGTITYEMDYFEKVSVSGKKAKTITYSKPKEKNLKDLTEAFDSIITGFFDDGDITDMSGKLVTDENGILLNETLTIKGLAHSNGQLGDFTLEFSMERTKTGDEVPKVFAPAEADKFKEVSDIEALLALPAAAIDMVSETKANFDLKYSINLKGEVIMERTRDMNLQYSTYPELTFKATRAKPESSEKTKQEIVITDVYGNYTIKNRENPFRTATAPTVNIENFTSLCVAPTIPNVETVVDAKFENVSGNKKLSYMLSKEGYVEWAKYILENEKMCADSIDYLGYSESYVLLDKKDNVLQSKIQASFVVECDGVSVTMVISITRTNK